MMVEALEGEKRIGGGGIKPLTRESKEITNP